MAHGGLNKGALHAERRKLELYGRVLPSLELKRRRLTAELAQARADHTQTLRLIEERHIHTSEQLPMFGNFELNCDNLVIIEDAAISEENVVGVRLPRLERLSFHVEPYALLSRPPWVDILVESLKQTVHLQLIARIQKERERRIYQAYRRLTQRVNLLEKILVPRTKKQILRIQMFLGDAERAAVVRSKIAKARRHAPTEEARP